MCDVIGIGYVCFLYMYAECQPFYDALAFLRSVSKNSIDISGLQITECYMFMCHEQ